MDYGKCKAVFSAANCKKREHRQNYCDEIIHKMEAHKMIKDEKTSIRPLDDDDNMFIKYSDIFFPRSFVQIRRSSICVARYPDTALFISILFTNNSEKRKKPKRSQNNARHRKGEKNGVQIYCIHFVIRHHHQLKVKWPTSFNSGVVQCLMFECIKVA